MQNQDPRELKRQRNREYYAKNKDEIAKRRRQARELQKQSTTPDIDENMVCDTPNTGQSGVTQPCKTPGAGQTQRSDQSWYARLTDDKKTEYKQKQNLARQKKKALNLQLSHTTSASLQSSQRTPLSNITNTHAKGVCIGETGSAYSGMTSELHTPCIVPCVPIGVCIICIGKSGSAYSGMTRDLHTPCNDSVMLDDDDNDWLHINGTYMRDLRSVEELQNVSTSSGLHGEDSFLAKSAYAEKKRRRDSSEETRQRHRERYLLMPDGQRDERLHKNREYKKPIRDTRTISEPSDNLQTGIFEPTEQGDVFEDNLDTNQDEEIVDDDDEECRIFSGLAQFCCQVMK